MAKRPDTAVGVLVINKPAGMTSHDVVAKLRRLYSMTSVGHTGTLDPMATGVLPILLGRAVKASEYLTAENKCYTAILELGITTDTEDTSGKVLSRSDLIPDGQTVLDTVRSFLGEYCQIPPMYSAIKKDGVKLVDLAREGIVIEREARRVTIHAIDALELSHNEYLIRVRCSKGTYIRTLCHDIGERLGCGGAMAALERTESGPFSLNDSVTLEEIEAMSEEERYRLPMPIEKCFLDLASVPLSDFYAKLARSGNELYQRKLGTDYPIGEKVRLSNRGEFFALGEVRAYPDGSAIKPIKLFAL